MPLSNEHVKAKILAKIKIYVLTRVELLLPYAMRYPVLHFHSKYHDTNLFDWKNNDVTQQEIDLTCVRWEMEFLTCQCKIRGEKPLEVHSTSNYFMYTH